MSISEIRLDAPPSTPAPIAVVPALTCTVPKEYVHRAAVAEVFLTGWARCAETRFTVTGEWPRSHMFFAPNTEDLHDPTIAAETIRQAGLLLCHAELGVPLDHHFLMHDLRFRVLPERLAVGGAPAALEIEVECTEVKRRAGALCRLRYEAVLRRDGAVVATGGASTSTISPQVYRRMRSEITAGAPKRLLVADPYEVGRRSIDDVVLSPTDEPDHWLLRLDLRHPVIFDHPVDHIPGMALLEAARQATVAAIGTRDARLLSMAVGFTRYGELADPCLIEARPLPGDDARSERSVQVTGIQNGEQVFSAIVTAIA